MIELVEVSPRDGLQNHPTPVDTALKVELITRAAAAGFRRIEVASFSHPRVVPNMADAEEVVAATAGLPGLTRIGLVLNERGLDRALASGVEQVNMVVVVTETFSQRNQAMSVDEAVESWRTIARRARANGLPAGVTLSAAFGCPYEGAVHALRVVELACRVAEEGPVEISLADTIGAAVPSQVGQLVGDVLATTRIPVRAHLHDTRGTALANAVAAIDAGATAIDGSLGGLGGCPFAPGASGNAATEDLAWCLKRMNLVSGIDLEAALATVAWLRGALGVDLGGHVFRAGPFPPSPK